MGGEGRGGEGRGGEGRGGEGRGGEGRGGEGRGGEVVECGKGRVRNIGRGRETEWREMELFMRCSCSIITTVDVQVLTPRAFGGGSS